MNQKKQIICFLVAGEFTNINREAYYLKTLEQHGIEYLILDITALIFTSRTLNNSQHKDIYQISTYSELIMYFKSISSRSLVFNAINFELRFYKLFIILRYFNFFGYRQGIILSMNLPPLTKRNQSLRFMKNILFNTLYKIGVFKKKDFAFVAGNILESSYPAKKIICIHSFLYDDSIKESTTRLINENYIVFLDQDLPYHLDLVNAGYNLDKHFANEYFKNMKVFFSKLESVLKCKVIIALHPKGDHVKASSNYERMVHQYKTEQLVKYAELCITHCSTSLGYAVLYKKPIVFLSSDLIETKLYRIDTAIHQFASYFKQKVILANQDIVRSKLHFNEQRYENYKFDYLMNPKYKSSSSSEIFIKELKCLM